ncbi:MAG TPA: NADP-dependent phosphogluconate dehydrogenase, partial [Streptosporangiaceae bacterium]|nr:NADP-dependent phosphogluconate dehydrogenase [Streptosporangiaceae bacterium]
MAAQAQIGVTGLGVMGRNLARNFASHGYTVALHNRTASRVTDTVNQFGHEGTFVATQTAQDFVQALERPRRLLIMVNAGEATDAVINEFAPLLEPGDMLIDGGNAHFLDTRRREAMLKDQNLHFVGMGVSGGEEGALLGPSIMPGGSPESYQALGPMLETISAHVDGTPCCTHIGPDGAGHFVKMVHNGIEYGMMAAIAEGLSIIRGADAGLHMDEVDAETAPLRDPWAYKYEIDVSDVAEVWRRGSVISSWLIDLTAAAFAKSPDLAGFSGRVSDSGEGRWTVLAAVDEGVPASVIAASL